MKTFQNPKKQVSNDGMKASWIDGRWCEWDEEEIFWRYGTVQHPLRSLWRPTPTHKAGQAVPYSDALAFSFLDVLERVLRSELLP